MRGACPAKLHAPVKNKLKKAGDSALEKGVKREVLDFICEKPVLNTRYERMSQKNKAVVHIRIREPPSHLTK